ncbi:PEP-CTERM sorting domain-containing protein, partial [Roseateles sp. GG27B]
MTHSKTLSLSFAAAAIAVLMAPISAQAVTATIGPVKAANSNGAGLVLSADLLGQSVVRATLPGPVTVFGTSLGAITGMAATGSTTTGWDYNSHDSVVSAIAKSATLADVSVLGTRTLTTANVGLAATVLDGTASFSNATQVLGYGGVTGLNLALGLNKAITTALATTNVPLSLGLTADALKTTSTIKVVANQLVGSNTLNSFTNVHLNLSSLLDGTLPPSAWNSTFSNSLDLSALVGISPAANSQLAGVAGSFLASLGLTLTLNEQFNTCSGLVTTCSVETNALHLTADPLNVRLAGLDLKLGHSYAEVTNFTPTAAVPEPATYAMMGLGLLGVMFGARRKSKQV